MNEVINQFGGFYNNSIYYGGTDSMYIQKKSWSDLVDNRFIGKSLGLGKTDYGNSSTFYAWFLAPKIKYCLMVDDFGVISAEKRFKSYSEEHNVMKVNEFISLSEGKTILLDFQLIGLKHLKEKNTA